MSYNVTLNDTPVASADTLDAAIELIGNPCDGRWVVEDGYGRPVWIVPRRERFDRKRC